MGLDDKNQLKDITEVVKQLQEERLQMQQA